MGFDLYGAKSDDVYFRNNCWWWRPLWEYVALACKDILTDEDVEHCCYNDGYLIDKEKAETIAIRLTKLIRDGSVQKYKEERDKFILALPDEPCEHCHGTGTRNDAFVKGKCNACEGKGSRRPWVDSYPFSQQNVQDFADFCLISEGFKVY
jgi:hypothetical protein